MLKRWIEIFLINHLFLCIMFFFVYLVYHLNCLSISCSRLRNYKAIFEMAVWDSTAEAQKLQVIFLYIYWDTSEPHKYRLDKTATGGLFVHILGILSHQSLHAVNQPQVDWFFQLGNVLMEKLALCNLYEFLWMEEQLNQIDYVLAKRSELSRCKK